MKYLYISSFFILFANTDLSAQLCDDPKAVFELATNETYFCESNEPVIIDNKCDENNPLSCIDNMVLDWGDGTVVTLAANDFANKQHIYFYPDSIACLLPTNGKAFTISLTLNFLNGRSNKATHEVYVIPLPRARCTASPQAICLDPTASVTFNGTPSCHEMHYLWNFGEPSSGPLNSDTLASPTHVYSTPGNHLVRLIVSNDCGSDTTYISVQATNAVTPVASLIPSVICAPDTVAFINNSINAISYTWSVSGPPGSYSYVNGTSNTSKNPIVAFTVPGNYTVQLTAKGACDEKMLAVGTVVVRGLPSVTLNGDATGCLPAFQANFNASLLQSGNSTNITYLWVFSGGSPATATTTTTASPTVTYLSEGNFPVRVIAQNECGSDTAYWSVSVADVAQAIASFTPAPPGNCGPYTIEFTNSSTGSGGVFSWGVNQPSGWMFVDGTTQNSPSPHIRFTDPGNYVVTLSLPAAHCGGTTTWSQSFSVKTAPTAILPDTLQMCAPADIMLQSQFSNGGFAGVLPMWDAPGANPSSSSQSAQTFHYDQSGLFNIHFTAANSCGNLDLNVAVIIAERAADATIAGVPANHCGPFTTVFTNQSAGADAGNIFWNVEPVVGSGATPTGYEFTGGTNAGSSQVSILFNTHGQYRVTLHFAGAVCGIDSIWSEIIEVKTAPQAGFAPVPDDCAPMQLTPSGFFFDDGGDPAATAVWIVNGAQPSGSSQLTPPPTFSFDTAGAFALVFSASNVCADTLVIDSFRLTDKTPIQFTAFPDTVCKYGPAVPLSPNPAGIWSIGAGLFNPSNEFLPLNGQSEWNVFEHQVGTGNCLVTRTDSIYVIDRQIDAGTPASVCDTVDCVTFTGVPLLGAIWSSSDGSINPLTGQICAKNAGFGVHKIWHTLTESILGCVFRDSSTFSVFPKPEAAPSGPQVGCVNLPVTFSNLSSGFDSWQWHYGSMASAGTADSTFSFSPSGAYSIFLVVNNAWCSDTAGLQIQIVDPPVVALGVSDDEICPQEGVTLTNLSTGNAVNGYSWNIGGTVFQGFEPTGPVYFNPGIEDTTYVIELNAAGVCPDVQAFATVLVHPLPHMYLTPSLDTTCSGDTLAFSLGTTGGAIFNIQFSANDTMTQGLPLPYLTFFTLNDSTSLSVTAIVSGENVCATTADTAFVVIVPNEAHAFFDLSVPVVCVGDTLRITSGATPVGAAVSYDFGDGTTGTDPNVQKVYDKPGIYRIRQTARTLCGYHFIDRYVRVNPAPAVDFAHDSYRCVGAPMHFWLTVDSMNRSVFWDFGMGNTSTAIRPEQAFPFDSLFPVSLTIRLDSSGCDATVVRYVEIKPNPVAAFTASDTLACGTLRTKVTASPVNGQFYEWTASNGNTAIGNHASFVFSDSGSYSIQLITSDIWGCKDDTTVYNFHVLPEPEAGFTIDKPWGCGVPATVQLTETASADALGFEWYFPDGSQNTQNNPSYTFQNAGDYQIRQIVRNIYACADTVDRIFRAFEQPIADFALANSTACQFEPLDLENLSQYANAWLWVFGGVDTSTMENPAYPFQQPGLHDIMLIAMRDSFCFDTLLRQGFVDVKPAPEAGFFVVDSMPNGYPEGRIYIFSTAIGATDWDYDFGNGQPNAHEANPFVEYGLNIHYRITQIVSNQWGCRDTATLDTIPANFGGLYVPNAFVPEVSGGDYALFLPKGRGLASYRVRVYSPTGQLVFESNELINGSPAIGWDGNDFNGKPCPQGAFAWLIEAQYETTPSRAESLGGRVRNVTEAGSVLLIR